MTRSPRSRASSFAVLVSIACAPTRLRASCSAKPRSRRVGVPRSRSKPKPTLVSGSASEPWSARASSISRRKSSRPSWSVSLDSSSRSINVASATSASSVARRSVVSAFARRSSSAKSKSVSLVEPSGTRTPPPPPPPAAAARPPRRALLPSTRRAPSARSTSIKAPCLEVACSTTSVRVVRNVTRACRRRPSPCSVASCSASTASPWCWANARRARSRSRAAAARESSPYTAASSIRIVANAAPAAPRSRRPRPVPLMTSTKYCDAPHAKARSLPSERPRFLPNASCATKPARSARRQRLPVAVPRIAGTPRAPSAFDARCLSSTHQALRTPSSRMGCIVMRARKH